MTTPSGSEKKASLLKQQPPAWGMYHYSVAELKKEIDKFLRNEYNREDGH